MSQLSRDAKTVNQLLTPREEFLGTCSESEMDCGGSWFPWSQAEWEVLPHQDQSTPSLPGHGRDLGFPSGWRGLESFEQREGMTYSRVMADVRTD